MRWRDGIGMPPLPALGGRKRRAFNRQPEQLLFIIGNFSHHVYSPLVILHDAREIEAFSPKARASLRGAGADRRKSQLSI